MAQVKATFFLPVVDNDGRDLKPDIETVRYSLFALFVGWTFLGYVKGAFLMSDGTQVIDDSEAYMVILDEDRLGDLEQVLRDFKAKTLQEAIYLEVIRHMDVRLI
jgi:hypothetical protein